MNTQKIQSALQEALEEKIPSKNVHLWPRVQAGLIAGKRSQGNQKMKPSRQRLLMISLAITALLVMALLTPPGRTLAQRVFQFFTVTDQKSFPIPTEQVLPAPPTSTSPAAQVLPLQPAPAAALQPTAIPTDCSAPAARASYACQVQAAESQADFNAREFPADPQGMTFSSATSAGGAEIDMEFGVTGGGGYLYLRQGLGALPQQASLWGQVPADAVQQVTVNGQYAELVEGGYIVYPNATQAVWEPGGRITLAWQEGGRWFVLEKMGDPFPIEWMTKDELIKLAEGLVDERPAGALPPLDPEYLTSVEQAEALAGFDIPTPALLPAGFELKRVVWGNNTARLMYGPKESPESELFIFLGQIANNQADPSSELPPGAVESVQVGGWPGWYWQGIYHSFYAEEGQPTQEPVWEGHAPNWSLAWNTDAFWFSMFYSPAYNSGKETNRDTLIQIAESMQ